MEEKGYKVKTKGAAHSHKLPMFCPCCSKITGSVDDKWLLEFGFCWECHTLYVSDRETPAIDLAKYKPR